MHNVSKNTIYFPTKTNNWQFKNWGKEIKSVAGKQELAHTCSGAKTLLKDLSKNREGKFLIANVYYLHLDCLTVLVIQRWWAVWRTQLIDGEREGSGN